MSEKEKRDGARIRAALDTLPDTKREYILGYAEGLSDGKKLSQAITEAAETAKDEDADE